MLPKDMAGELPLDDLEIRRRRALWRATHRGTKELDLLIGGYATALLPGMPEAELERFETFLHHTETELQAQLLAAEPPGDIPFADILNAVRAFHGLKPAD